MILELFCAFLDETSTTKKNTSMMHFLENKINSLILCIERKLNDKTSLMASQTLAGEHVCCTQTQEIRTQRQML